MFRALHRHGAPILAAGLSVPVFALSGNALSEQRVYVSGEALGRGVRLEYWKAKHENVVVLDLESELIQMGMTRIRDRSSGGAQFVHDATAVIHSTLDLALTELPNDEDAVVTTPNGHKVQGVVFEDDVKVCGIVLSKKREIFDSLLKVMEHSLPFESPLGSILIEETPKGDIRIVKATLPDGLEGHDVMLLVPDLNAIEKIKKTIHLLRQQGVEEEKITVVTLITCPEAADKFCQTFPSARLVTSSFDATRDSNGSIVPGFGDFEDRYLGIAGAIVDDKDEGQDNEKEEMEKPNLQQKLTSWWGFGSGK